MSALDAIALLLLLFLPLHPLVRRELDKLSDPRYLRRHGVVIVSERALEGHSAPIGEYMGRPIWGSVRFKGMDYRFHHVTDKRNRAQPKSRELFLDPGLIYVTD
jgi:hypothetical protein